MLVCIVQLRIRPGVEPDESPPELHMAANALCAHAMLIIRGDNYRDFPRAYTSFNKAIELDPNFARAYAGLLELRCREAVPGLGQMRPDELRRIAIPGRYQNPPSVMRTLAWPDRKLLKVPAESLPAYARR